MLDLEPPKPTKEFHEAYMEIYGKGKKRDDKVVQKPIADTLSLSAMDVPPLKKPLFSFLSKDKKTSLDSLDQPPIKTDAPKKPLFSFTERDLSDLDKLNLPPVKIEQEPEPIVPKKPLFSFGQKDLENDLDISQLKLPPLKIPKPSQPKKPYAHDIPELDKLDLPPLKIPAPQPATFQPIPSLDNADIESPAKEIEIIGAKAPIYDFLAEVKHGKRQIVEPVRKPAPKAEPKKIIEPAPLPKEIPIFHEPVFEKTAAQKGARDMQIAFEQEHKEELAAEKPSSNTPIFSFEEPAEDTHELPKVKPFKSPAEFKQYMKQAKSYEQKLKKLNTQSKKTQQEIAHLLIKQNSHDAKLNEKMNKIAFLEKELQEKHQESLKTISQMEDDIRQKEGELSQYEPKMQELCNREDNLKTKEDNLKTKEDNLKAKEHELHQRQQVKEHELYQKQQAKEHEIHQNQQAKEHEIHQKQQAKEHEIHQKQQDLLDTEARLKTEENSIIAKIKRLEADQKLLEKEQTAIVKSVQKLEKDKEEITVKTQEFADIMKKITFAEKELKERTDLFVERENHIKRKEQLVEKELARLATLKKKSEKLKEVEQTYERMKHRLRDAYEEYEQRFASKESYAPQKLTLEPTVKVIEEKPTPQAADTGDITNLINYTRKLVLEKKYEEASRNITKLMHRYMQVPDNNPRKKEIYYEILSIKNMLKLDLLD